MSVENPRYERLNRLASSDPYDDRDPWPVPDSFQCPAEDEAGHRCVLSVNHLPRWSSPDGHLMKTVLRA